MRIEGKLAKWNDDRGFGFITPNHGGPEVFVHISVFPKDGHRPTVGEHLTFEIELDSNGKKRAKNLLRPGRPIARNPIQSIPHRRNEKRNILGRVIPIVLIAGLAFYGHREYTRRIASPQAVAATPIEPAVSSSFQCDGRTHCSQMTSCAEATFFLRNCPNVEMDGDHDGVPCEQQWCANSFSN